MPQMKSAAQLPQRREKQDDLKNGTGSTTQVEKGKKNASAEIGATKDTFRISPGLKTLAAGALATNIAAQQVLLTKKPEGIHISRSKHWKFISSYHGPYLPTVTNFDGKLDGYNCLLSC
jgi:hypothetical protein